jgi:hypothetical protein
MKLLRCVQLHFVTLCQVMFTLCCFTLCSNIVATLATQVEAGFLVYQIVDLIAVATPATQVEAGFLVYQIVDLIAVATPATQVEAGFLVYQSVDLISVAIPAKIGPLNFFAGISFKRPPMYALHSMIYG